MGSNSAAREYVLANEPFSDTEIVSRVRAGDTALYEVLMRRYNQRLFRVTRSILQNDDEAEDVIQDAYVRAYTSLYQFEGRAQFSTWLTKIAIHEALGRLKAQKRLRVLPGTPPEEGQSMESIKSSSPDPEQQALRRQAASFLEQAIDALPQMYRCVFVCREIEGMSTSETARCLDVTDETVKIRLYRARQILQSKLYELAGATSSQAFEFMGERCDRVVWGVFGRLREL